ncbi:methyltransferase type 12 [Shewanella colwelliana]|uniref:Histidine kinase n=1 Tax=Shewanella colwelliana TaxID=23 RepID=A0A1E5ISI2_SHECO|nr:methyltransferase domain-containing protein [Shewanella colwelliana]MDX1281945.1 methyltransferase domain-containing protein [Shewanella colwelliana]OEG73519.1 histidine kinase [Shewanella colwelliana]GIU24899.1 methyltransferase type 12 [Shewanella colwelliana]GIU40329.1 methyltransferase type 12 [Shewanella colwelliana]
MSPVRLRYQTLEFPDTDIHVRSLRDRQEFADPLGEANALGISSAQWSLFGVIWDSGRALAHEMVAFDIAGKRILEVGCGMAVASLLLNSREADITATDYHPEAGNFLIENVRLNQGSDIPFLRTDWNNLNDGLGQFDLIIGADLLYEREHIELLSQFIHRHTKPDGEVILIDPGRGNHAQFSKKMCALGYSHLQHKIMPASDMSSSFKGQMLCYSRTSLTPD